MECLRCKTKMKHYEFNQDFNIYGSWYKAQPFSTERQKQHNPHSVFICENCGYVEFSTKYCKNPDI